jgi:hypothetical protein
MRSNSPKDLLLAVDGLEVSSEENNDFAQRSHLDLINQQTFIGYDASTRSVNGTISRSLSRSKCPWFFQQIFGESMRKMADHELALNNKVQGDI